MKHLFLIAAFLPLSAFGQRLEFGLNGGFSTNGMTSGNLYYQGDKMCMNYAANFTFAFNVNNLIQLGADIYAAQLASKSSIVYIYFGEQIGDDDKKFLYASPAFSFCPFFNFRIFTNSDNYLYLGMAGGYAGTMNNSNTKPEDFLGQDYTYTAPNGGLGPCLGGQLGYNFRVSKMLAINGQLAIRHYSFSYDSYSYNGSSVTANKLQYDLTALMVTFGIRYLGGHKSGFDFKNRSGSKFE